MIDWIRISLDLVQGLAIGAGFLSIAIFMFKTNKRLKTLELQLKDDFEQE